MNNKKTKYVLKAVRSDIRIVSDCKMIGDYITGHVAWLGRNKYFSGKTKFNAKGFKLVGVID